MKLGFFGHSDCRSRKPQSFTKILADRLDAKLINVGSIQGSQERIAYELKKSKNLDLAVIFHSYPVYLFLPGCDRDFNVQHSLESRADYLWKNRSHLDVISENWKDVSNSNPRFYMKFKNPENFLSVMSIYKEYFYDFELLKNRFEASLLQIDSILTNKKIAAIHIIDKHKNYIPKWFEFNSGIVDLDLYDIIENYREMSGPNNISIQGNCLIADYIFKLATSGRVVHTPGDQSGDGGSNPPVAPIQ
jgi:hypothetical protein